MRPVYVNGYSHASAMGEEHQLAENVRAYNIPVSSYTLPIADTEDLSYYRFDSSLRKNPHLMQDTVARALTNSTVEHSQLLSGHYFFGSSSNGIDEREKQIINSGQVALKSPYGLNHPYVAVIEKLGVTGPYISFNTACTSSVNALLAASRMISAGQIDHAIVIGMETLNVTTLAGFYSLQLLGNEIRPFDQQRGGIILGEAISAVVLSCHAHDNYSLQILGGANHGDTTSPTGTDEQGNSIARVINEAIQRCGLSPRNIDFIKAQAAGSAANDGAEARGLHQVFQQLPTVGSVKPYIGHTLGASGCSELSLLLSCFRAGFIPATPGFSNRDEVLGILPLTEHSNELPQHCLLNFFGFGGNNSTLVVKYAE